MKENWNVIALGTPELLCNNEDAFLPLQGLDSLQLFPFKG